MDPLLIDAPYDSVTFLNAQNPYDCGEGLDTLLDLAREIQDSGNYYWQGVSFPDSNSLVIAPQVTVNGTLQIPEGTYVTAIQMFARKSADFTASGGFRVKLYDKGTKASIFYGDYVRANLVASEMQVQTLSPWGLGYLTSPFIVTPPGVLGWEIVSMDASNNQLIQMMLCCAVPINKASIGVRVVSKVA
jgi:hypothetical protein